MSKNSFEDDIIKSIMAKKDVEEPVEEKNYSEFLPTEQDIKEISELAENKSPSISTDLIIPQEAKVINPSVERDVDYAYARDNLHDIIDAGKDALDRMKTVAMQTNVPRAFEVLALLLNTIVDSNKKLLDLHKQRQDLEIKEKEQLNKPETAKQNVTNNNLFVGSSSQLLEFVKNLQKPKEE